VVAAAMNEGAAAPIIAKTTGPRFARKLARKPPARKMRRRFAGMSRLPNLRKPVAVSCGTSPGPAPAAGKRRLPKPPLR